MDVAYYLIFTAYVLFTVTLSQPAGWGPNARDALGNQLQHEVSRIGGMLLLMGVLHGLNVLSLPLVGRLLGLSRHLDEDTPAVG
jgi:energy-converting hydrogenase Eha subunit E